MVLQFLCPQGHRIHCSDDRAGMPAKCPKCGVRFLVPSLSEFEEEATEPAESEESSEGGPVPVKADSDADGKAAESIEFLCPNQHRLYGPAALQGQRGQCPICGSQFRIPYREEIAAEPGSDSKSVIEPPDSDIGVQEGRPEGAEAPSDSQVPVAIPIANVEQSPSAISGHSMAKLFIRLWSQRSQGTKLELHLSDGQTLVPDHFASRRVKADYGLFAVREPDGTFTLAAVAWSSIARIVMRGLKRLPGDLKESAG